MSTKVTRKPASLDECLAVAQVIGMSEADARQWYTDCEVCDWCRGDGTPFDHWRYQMIIHRDKLRSKPTNGNHTSERIAWQRELDRIEKRLEETQDYSAFPQYSDSVALQRKEWRVRRSELIEKLGFKA